MRFPATFIYTFMLLLLVACSGAPSESLPGPCTAEQGGALISYSYRFDGQLVGRDGPGAEDRIRFFYDGAARLALVDFPRGENNQIVSMLRYRYDAAGRLDDIERQLGSTGPIVQRTRFAYDSSNRVDFREDEALTATAEPLRVDYLYDAGGRLVVEEPEFGPLVSYVYVERGILRHKDQGDVRTLYEVDEYGNIMSETVVSAHDETEIKQQWLYDYSCWNEKSEGERGAPRIDTPYLSATVR